MQNNTEQITKRRNSILKKPPTNDDDTTGDVTAKIKRRISFSGKKSVKEFIAGDEEATIWGTSYEESAECLQANSAESGLVNLNEKRIVLRNRRVVVDHKSSSRRRSKKKVHIAANDKENIFIHPPDICLPGEGEPVAKAESLSQSQLTSPRRLLELKIQAASGSQDGLNVWSSTFDFINCTAATNKTITIENSVDVSLNEDELQMLKFRVPVTATDVSPNLSLDSPRDGPSPNIFSRSILMSEEDVKMLKSLKRKTITKAIDMKLDRLEKHFSNTRDISSKDTNSPMRKKPMYDATTKPMDITNDQNTTPEEQIRRQTIHFDSAAIKESEMYALDVPEYLRQTMHFDEDPINEERACPNKVTSRSDVVAEGDQINCNISMELSVCDPPERESIAINSQSPTKNLQTLDFDEQGQMGLAASKRRQSIHTPDAMIEDSPRSVNGAQVRHHESTKKEVNLECPMLLQSMKSPKSSVPRQRSIYDSTDVMEESIPIACPDVKQRQSTYTPSDILEVSPNSIKLLQKQISEVFTASKMNLENRQSVYTPADIMEDSPTKISQLRKSNNQNQPTTVQLTFSNARTRVRESIYTPADIIEDSPKSTRTCETTNSNVRQRQTTSTSTDKAEDLPENPPSSISGLGSYAKQRQSATVQLKSSNAKNTLRESNYTPADIIEDSPQSTRTCETNNSNVRQRQTTYTPTDIAEDLPENPPSSISGLCSYAKHRQSAPVQLKSSNAKSTLRESIYTPADIIEDSPQSTRTCEATKSNVRQRQTTYTLTDIAEDLPENPPSSISGLGSYAKHRQSAPVQLKSSNAKSTLRESIYTPADIIEYSPQSTRTCEATKSNVRLRHTTYTSTDIAEDLPENPPSSISGLGSYAKHRQSAPVQLKSSNAKSTLRESIYTPADIIEDSPQSTRTCETNNSNVRQRQTTYTPTDIAEDLPENPPSSISELCSYAKHRQSAPVQLKSSNAKNTLRESIYTPADIIEDSPQSTRTCEATKSNVRLRHTTYTSTDIAEDLPENPPSSISGLGSYAKHRQSAPVQLKSSNAKSTLRESIYTPADIIEDSPKSTRTCETTNSNVRQRQTNYTSTDIAEDLPENPPSSISGLGSYAKHRQSAPVQLKSSNAKSTLRESIYTPADIIEDSPKSTRTCETTNSNVRQRQTNYTSTDIAEDLPENPPSSISGLGSYAKHRQSAPVQLKSSNAKSTLRESIYTPADIIEDSPKSTRTCETTNSNVRQRQTNYTSTDIAEDLPENPPSLIARFYSNAKQRQSIYITSGMDEDCPKSSVSAFKCTAKQRQSVYTPTDMIEDSPKFCQSSVPIHKSAVKYRQSVYTPTDMIEDFPKTARPPNIALDDTTENGQSIYNSSNMSNESPPKLDTIQQDEIEDLQKSPILSRIPKAIGKHLNFQQTLLGNETKPKGKTKADDSCMDMSVLDELHNQFKENDNQQMRLFNETKRNTAENALMASKSTRRTVHFEENNNLEESVQAGRDDSTMNLSIAHDHANQEQQPTLPLPRRPTIFDAYPVDIEESPPKISIRKSSFSRTLNFNAIQTSTSKCQTQTADDMDMSIQDQAPTKVIQHTKLVNDDSPLYYYNPKSKHNETTTEIDRSLAEYLKAEVAATLFPTDSLDMSVNISDTEQKSVYYDAEEEQHPKPRRQTSFEPVNISEESGMEPLQERQSLIDSKAVESHLETGRNIRTTEPHTEKSGNFMELDMPPEKPFESKETITRKTIHFTNENAVDESFFDEKQSKPVPQNQKNRQTIYFNTQNPISEMDVTSSVNKAKSTGIQSLKDILQESTMHFTQSKLVKPSAFDNKRSTIFFACKDDSMEMSTANENMECESPETTADPECTPTKFSKSRIPQLIGSAKKLQSMKKSMEFIQQELPNLSYPVHRDGTAEESVDNTESHSPDIPRRATTFKSKLFEESFETAGNPRKTTTNQQQLPELSDTIEIPRRATTFQRNDTLYLSQNEVDVTNMSQKSLYKFEDAPITVSDVSTFFAQKPIPVSDDKNETYSPNTTETSCNLAVNGFTKEDHMPKSSDSEDTTHNFDKFKKRYVELTCDSIVLSDMMEDIEKTHLSLVNTLDEQSEVVHSACPQQSAIIETEPDKVVATVPSPSAPLKPISSVCRKCKHHRLSTTQNETTIGSFMVEPIPEYKMDLAALEELATKPRISDVAKVWQQKLRESDSFNISDESRGLALDDQESVEEFIAALNNERILAAQQRQRKVIKSETSFITRVREQMQSKKSNWILNELLLAGGVLKFTHTRIRTFAILISFTPKDPRGIEVNFNEIQLVPNVLHSHQWTSFDYALHYQLLVELPFDLRKLCPTSENLFELLEHVEKVTEDVLKTGKDMLYLVLTSPASLIRESSGSLYIRKYARTRTPQNEVKRVEFQIEVRNIKNLSYESIAVPPLYEFDEKIQLLPVGQDFLRIFLADPMRYMKT